MTLIDEAEKGRKLSKEELERELPELRVQLLNAQFDLRQRGEFPVLVLVAGDDRLGCDEVFDRLHEWLDARLLVSHAFSFPTDEERERPPGWRYWRALPPRGRIGVFFGAWATHTLAERLLKRIGSKAFHRRCELVRSHERMLVADGTLVVKLWLHLSKKEHEKRLRRAKNGDEDWRFGEEDRAIVEQASKARALADKLLEKTDTPEAPWTVIDGSDRQHRDLAVARTLRDALLARLAAAPAPPRVELAPFPRGALSAVDLTARLADDDYDRLKEELQERLGRLARKARRKGISTVLAFEGWDAAGKGGCIRRLTQPMSARDYRVVSISAPSEEERAHHYLWRFWRPLPRAGHMTIFDRSWYGRVLVERIEGFAHEHEWQRAYSEIVDFEGQLVDHGIVLAKFWLQIDPQEQLRRFEARRQTPYKKYKLTPEDYRNRGRWDEYAAAADEMIARTDAEGARWSVVSSQDKQWARIQVLETVCNVLHRKLASFSGPR